jgi:hypothetical protein|tara:strand:+ start:306 stop:752 length:447 start_codon:yes stop_codon:yes gene_type:complete
MLVKLKRKWFAPDSIRYRQFDPHGAVEVPDKLLLDIPSDAEVEQIDGSWIRAEELKEQIADGSEEEEGEEEDDEEEDEEEEPEDPSAAFKKALAEETTGTAPVVDTFGAAQAAHTAAAEKAKKALKKTKGKTGGKAKAKAKGKSRAKK